ncbi:MAG TPA: hypothetical protein PLY96_09190 [Chromatiaceae bacterium]|nr:hypothetical protein [Chromatiaceae bacterium]
MNKSTLAIASTLVLSGGLMLGYSQVQASGYKNVESGEGTAIHVIVEGSTMIDAKAMIVYTSAFPSLPSTEKGCWTKNPWMIESAADAVIGQTRIQLEWYLDHKGVPWCTSLKLIGDQHDMVCQVCDI